MFPYPFLIVTYAVILSFLLSRQGANNSFAYWNKRRTTGATFQLSAIRLNSRALPSTGILHRYRSGYLAFWAIKCVGRPRGPTGPTPFTLRNRQPARREPGRTTCWRQAERNLVRRSKANNCPLKMCLFNYQGKEAPGRSFACIILIAQTKAWKGTRHGSLVSAIPR